MRFQDFGLGSGSLRASGQRADGGTVTLNPEPLTAFARVWPSNLLTSALLLIWSQRLEAEILKGCCSTRWDRSRRSHPIRRKLAPVMEKDSFLGAPLAMRKLKHRGRPLAKTLLSFNVQVISNSSIPSFSCAPCRVRPSSYGDS